MPITTNVGGVLHQLTGVYGTDGGVIKPMGGVKTDDLPLNWGGFDGTSTNLYYNTVYMGEFTIKDGAYLGLSYQNTDDLSNHYNDNTCFDIVNAIIFRKEKSLSSSFYYRIRDRWTNSPLGGNIAHTNEYDLTDLTDYNRLRTFSTRPFDEGTYYVYAGKFAVSSSSRTLYATNKVYEWDRNDCVNYTNASFISNSELSFKFNIKIQEPQI